MKQHYTITIDVTANNSMHSLLQSAGVCSKRKSYPIGDFTTPVFAAIMDRLPKVDIGLVNVSDLSATVKRLKKNQYELIIKNWQIMGDIIGLAVSHLPNEAALKKGARIIQALTFSQILAAMEVIIQKLKAVIETHKEFMNEMRLYRQSKLN